MRALVQGFACLSLPLLAACSTGSESSPAGSATPFDDVHPPSNIDIASCKAIARASDSQGTSCSTCCTKAGMPISGFIYKDQCTCGKPFDDAGASVCADQASTSNLCRTCCSNASYQGDSWLGVGDGGSCTCNGKRDGAICAATTRQPSAGDACAACCVNNGYLGSMYVAIGAPECACSN